jgi:glycerophosphoryl diester phosphodiesterase
VARAVLVVALFAAAGAAERAMDVTPDGARPIVIAHRGASGERPEHTLASYALAIEQGADYVEPDLVSTKDGVLVARHENEISGTTDVASRPEFAARRTMKTIDGVAVTGWFTEDFTLAEIRTLRARERLPRLRGTRFDGQLGVPTFDEVLDLVAAANGRPARTGRPGIGVYPETKHPSYFASIGLALEPPLLAALRRHGLDAADAPVFIQSFETANLKALARETRVPLVQLVEAAGRPYDLARGGDSRTYADLVTPSGLAAIARYARAVGVEKALVLPRDAEHRLRPATTLVADAHRAGLLVHVWTLRAENEFLPAELRSGRDPASRGDLATEARLFLEAGVDGYFTDHPAEGVSARDAFLAARSGAR